jgi:ATP-dependent Lon protease
MSRRWTTGEPTIPVAVMRAHRHASPAIVLDDLDAANEALSAALLSMLEPHSARAWYDPYVEAPVDLSHILWVATAQSLDGLPRALRERWKIITFPCPRADHLEVLVRNVLGTLMAERGMDPRWAPPLSGAEHQLLRRYWRGWSLRYLTRLIEEILAARKGIRVVH